MLSVQSCKANTGPRIMPRTSAARRPSASLWGRASSATWQNSCMWSPAQPIPPMAITRVSSTSTAARMLNGMPDGPYHCSRSASVA